MVSTQRCQRWGISSILITCIFSTSYGAGYVLLTPLNNRTGFKRYTISRVGDDFYSVYHTTKRINNGENKAYSIKNPSYIRNHHYYMLDNRVWRVDTNIKYKLAAIGKYITPIENDYNIYNVFFGTVKEKEYEYYFYGKYYNIYKIFDEISAITNGCLFLKQKGIDYSEYKKELDIYIQYAFQIRNIIHEEYLEDCRSDYLFKNYTEIKMLIDMMENRWLKL